jgi:hypothetical protein
LDRRVGEEEGLRQVEAILELAFKRRQAIGVWGTTDGICELTPERFVVVEVDGGQHHPQATIGKYWPWLEEHPESRLLLVHAFDLQRRRRRQAEWMADKMKSALRGRFAYEHVELPLHENGDDADRLRSALRRFRRTAAGPNRTFPFFAYGFLRPHEIAYPRIEPFVDRVPERATLKGRLLERDGLVVLDPDGADLNLLWTHADQRSGGEGPVGPVETRRTRCHRPFR